MRVRVSAVSYLNTLPFVHGIKTSGIEDSIDLSLDIPSDCASKLLNDEVDVGLVPVAIIPDLKESYIISDYCIGAEGKVDTVALYADVPLHEIEKVYLDYQSRTSVTLVRVLAERYWGITPEWIKAERGFEENIKGTTAGVVIGDRTFSLERKYKYDLAEEWKKYTGLPFVFACWVANKKVPQEFITQFNAALKRGVRNIEATINHLDTKFISKDRLYEYLTNSISFTLDEEKREALKKFLEIISQKSES